MRFLLLAACAASAIAFAEMPKEVSKAPHNTARAAQPSHAPKRVLFLGDSITDRHHIGCTKNYWGFLGERHGFAPLVYGINGQQWCHIVGQAKAYAKEHAECPDVVFVFAGTNDFNDNIPLGEWYDVAEEEAYLKGKTRRLPHRRFRKNMDTYSLLTFFRC